MRLNTQPMESGRELAEPSYAELQEQERRRKQRMKAFQARMESVKVAEIDAFKEELKSGSATDLHKPLAFTYGGDGFFKQNEGNRNGEVHYTDHADPKAKTGAAFRQPARPATQLASSKEVVDQSADYINYNPDNKPDRFKQFDDEYAQKQKIAWKKKEGPDNIN